jgi:hypothetical protein
LVVDVSMPMVPIEIAPVESREKEATMLVVGGVVVDPARIDRQEVLAVEGGRVRDALQLAEERGDVGLDLSTCRRRALPP